MTLTQSRAPGRILSGLMYHLSIQYTCMDFGEILNLNVVLDFSCIYFTVFEGS